jgi:hypothetical protein
VHTEPRLIMAKALLSGVACVAFLKRSIAL